ncbi:sensor domain-containing diguanylate cyclase [Reinekea sp.]|uniref:GGDEF domain-containing protein n=1 Tax=Reinekea sp. TaxID=1970455 RepID=UPI002A80358E|nr:sensor domain-containing diguanylate cyclase [Reinekea sp.]
MYKIYSTQFGNMIRFDFSDDIQSMLDAFERFSHVGLQIHDNFKPIYMSKNMPGHYGFKSREEFLDVVSVLDLIPPDLRDLALERNQIALTVGHNDSILVRNQRSDGPVFWTKVQDTGISLNNQPVTLTLLQDVTADKEREHNLDSLASTDALTGIGNRRKFYVQAHELLNNYPHDSAVLIIDIDNLKDINDQYGHEVGDTVLRHFCAVTAQNIRRTDVFARFGGDEFTIFAPAIGLQRALALAEAIRHAMASRSIALNNLALTVTVSIGLALSDASAPEVASLLKAADKALYRSKAKGRNSLSLAGAIPVIDD